MCEFIEDLAHRAMIQSKFVLDARNHAGRRMAQQDDNDKDDCISRMIELQAEASTKADMIIMLLEQ